MKFVLLPFLLTLSFSAVSNPLEQKPLYKEIEWVDLMPKDDLDALLNPPDYINNIIDGSEDDIIISKLTNNNEWFEKNDRYQKALASTRIIASVNQTRIKIPGFIVPLEFDDHNTVTTFFVVPYFGACLHQPPPPPNQIIYSEFEPGIKLDTLFDPFWFQGTLTTSVEKNDVATAAYSLSVDTIEPYSDE